MASIKKNLVCPKESSRQTGHFPLTVYNPRQLVRKNLLSQTQKINLLQGAALWPVLKILVPKLKLEIQPLQLQFCFNFKNFKIWFMIHSFLSPGIFRKRMKMKLQEQKFILQFWNGISQNRPQCTVSKKPDCKDDISRVWSANRETQKRSYKFSYLLYKVLYVHFSQLFGSSDS